MRNIGNVSGIARRDGKKRPENVKMRFGETWKALVLLLLVHPATLEMAHPCTATEEAASILASSICSGRTRTICAGERGDGQIGDVSQLRPRLTGVRQSLPFPFLSFGIGTCRSFRVLLATYASSSSRARTGASFSPINLEQRRVRLRVVRAQRSKTDERRANELMEERWKEKQDRRQDKEFKWIEHRDMVQKIHDDMEADLCGRREAAGRRGAVTPMSGRAWVPERRRAARNGERRERDAAHSDADPREGVGVGGEARTRALADEALAGWEGQSVGAEARRGRAARERATFAGRLFFFFFFGGGAPPGRAIGEGGEVAHGNPDAGEGVGKVVLGGTRVPPVRDGASQHQQARKQTAAARQAARDGGADRRATSARGLGP
ncbi:hypothetical protein DFH07DRAFT_768899 [Mycena maculata]|uniref:Uncharacterized protein n=1 Tax=Mycena maculata TaxID=230809 RepID=A0AAD7JSM3_9AGAR|nr:hypothetical protein DFH07DRAFT_768899 [Mycena maculata]